MKKKKLFFVSFFYLTYKKNKKENFFKKKKRILSYGKKYIQTIFFPCRILYYYHRFFFGYECFVAETNLDINNNNIIMIKNYFFKS